MRHRLFRPFAPTLLLGLCASLALAAACGRRSEPPAKDPIRVSAAISLTETLRELADIYHKRTGCEIQLNFAGSNTLATQILAGAPADVFISADATQMDRVAAANQLLDGSRRNLLSNQLVAIVPAGSPLTIRTAMDLQQVGIARLAVGDPEAVPAGVYAKRYLDALGLWTPLQPRIVGFPHVRAVVAAVESQAAQAGMVYRTDARVSKGVTVAFAADGEGAPPIVYPVAVLRASRQPEAATAFVAYLQQDDSKRVFEAAGFLPVTP